MEKYYILKIKVDEDYQPTPREIVGAIGDIIRGNSHEDAGFLERDKYTIELDPVPGDPKKILKRIRASMRKMARGWAGCLKNNGYSIESIATLLQISEDQVRDMLELAEGE